MTEETGDTNQPDEDIEEPDKRTIWDITPTVVSVDLSEGKLSMSEKAVHNGRLRVHKAMQIGDTPDPDCANLYIQAKSRDGANVELDLNQAKDLRDALDECIEQTVETIENSKLEIDVSVE